jgi:hypothetical protein
MHIEHEHTLPYDDAKARMRVFAEYLTSKAGIKFAWDPEGDKATAHGKYLVVTIDAKVQILPDKVVFEGKDPGFLWRGKAESFIHKKLQTYLDPGTPVDALPRK